ncbi:MAG: hypothetical protein QM756_40315 [Polyangiaceae bacterium]
MSRRSYELFCEGYHDRAFLGGLLVSRPGWRDPRGSKNQPVLNPVSGLKVEKGRHSFEHAGGAFVEVVPAEGRPKVIKFAKQRVKAAPTSPLAGVIAVVDLDSEDQDLQLEEVLTQQRQHVQNIQGTFETAVSVVQWCALGPAMPGVPAKHTLERVVCLALGRAYSDRAAHVHRWLDVVAAGAPSDVKQFAWSYMAGWYAEHGCDDFYRCLWRDPEVVAHLYDVLVPSGIMEVLRELEA